MRNDLNTVLNNILLSKTYSQLAKEMNVAIGTIKRWICLKNVPKAYTFELLKLANIDINYSKYNFKMKDQFFTPETTAKYCYSKFKEVFKKYNNSEKEYTFIEPSAGNGVFLKLLPIERRCGLDIEPKFNEIIEQDYFNWNPDENKKYVVIGNPPFGLRGQLALKFINHSKFAEYVCFILPPLFDSDGRGTPRQRVVGLNLIHSEKLDTIFHSPNGKHINVKCIFQIWSKFHKNDSYVIKKNENNNIKIYSLSDGGTPSTTRNKKMFYKCDVYIPSTCFGKNQMKYYESFDNLPYKRGYGIVFIKDKKQNLKKFKNIDWSEVAFQSTNSAYNIRSSQITEKLK